MPSFTRLFTLTLLAVAINSAKTGIIPPSERGTSDSFGAAIVHPMTDHERIHDTAHLVNQKSGPKHDTMPNLPVPETSVTALDGELTSKKVSEVTGLQPSSKRDVVTYQEIFSGSGTGLTDRDGSIEGTAYLTYTVVSNATYNVQACLDFCTSVNGCVFANLFYEFNNYLLDFVFSEKSNLKCSLYGDVHNATEKTNLGGQQSIPPPAGLTYIQDSSGWASKALVDPVTPTGYDLVFGPTGGANNAPGVSFACYKSSMQVLMAILQYMGFAFIDRYDVDACAALCNTRGADANGGSCQYFNIWRALVNGVPTTYTCSFYYIPADASTAVNYGQGDLVVTYSRGYRRQSLAIDGGFEQYTCADFCFAASYAHWIGTSPKNGLLDASIFHYSPYAHTGSSVALLGSASGADAHPGTLAAAKPLVTVAGNQYVIEFFHSSVYGGQAAEKNAFFEVRWNGVAVKSFTPGYQPWTLYQITVTAKGKDKLAFHGGKAPAWSFIDDVNVWAL
ncbi:hypothetical protein H0H81_009688 [Sphagnurus paluster]|uniref:Fruit-body specific protein a n=1 Tax=Sphagnurus paluster TaxID=117069 RepID=A0A9P7FW60_9AGAR|nr:hypothetical protein H0H81_009688 [Sphagnurus paluster]